MQLWDKGTHMTKAEWKVACQRTQNRLQELGTKNVESEKRLNALMPGKGATR